MIKKIFSILIMLALFATPVAEVMAVSKTPTKTVVKKTTTKKVASKKTKNKKGAKKKHIIENPPLITLETAPHSAKKIARSHKKTKKKTKKA